MDNLTINQKHKNHQLIKEDHGASTLDPENTTHHKKLALPVITEYPKRSDVNSSQSNNAKAFKSFAAKKKLGFKIVFKDAGQ